MYFLTNTLHGDEFRSIKRYGWVTLIELKTEHAKTDIYANGNDCTIPKTLMFPGLATQSNKQSNKIR